MAAAPAAVLPLKQGRRIARLLSEGDEMILSLESTLSSYITGNPRALAGDRSICLADRVHGRDGATVTLGCSPSAFSPRGWRLDF